MLLATNVVDGWLRKSRREMNSSGFRASVVSMPFSDFYGNSEAVRQLRDMLARNRFPQAVILAGPAGSGKYTLALMLAKAMNCLAPATTDGLPDFCGKCSNCLRIAQAENLDARFAEAVEAREGMREADKKETRLFIQ